VFNRERFTWQRVLCQNAIRSVGKVPVGELSLSAEAECLSLPPDCSTDGQDKQAGGFPSADAVLEARLRSRGGPPERSSSERKFL
jgi:hypothetical protein